jgi:hypothetical protein
MAFERPEKVMHEHKPLAIPQAYPDRYPRQIQQSPKGELGKTNT